MGEMCANVHEEKEPRTNVALPDPNFSVISPIHLGAVSVTTQIEGNLGDAFLDHVSSDEVGYEMELVGSEQIRMVCTHMKFEARSLATITV